MLLLILVHAIFATTFTLNKAILTISSPIFYAGIKSICSGLIFFIYALKQKTKISSIKLIPIIHIGLLTIFLRITLKNIALSNMSSIKTAFFYNLSPFITAILSYILLNEKLSKYKFIGILIASIGMLINIHTHDASENLISNYIPISIEELFILLSITIGIISWLKIQNLVRNENYPISVTLGISNITGGILSLLTSNIIEPSPKITNINIFITYLTCIVIFNGIIGYSLYTYLHKKYSATLISLAGFTEPIFVAILSSIFLNENLTLNYIISMVLIFLGIIIFYKQELSTKKLSSSHYQT